MTLMRNQPVSSLRRFQDEMARLFDRDFPYFSDDGSTVETSQWLPSVDVKEEADRYVIFADIPGVDPKAIEVSMERGELTIRGERKEEKEEENQSFHRLERSKGVFYRRFSLPDTADSDGISASSNHGVLQVVIPKAKQSTSRRIEVK